LFLNSFIHQALAGTLAYLYRRWSSFAELRENTMKESFTSPSAPATAVTGWVLTNFLRCLGA